MTPATALDRAFAAIETAFGQHYVHDRLKKRCRALMRKGPGHHELWLYFHDHLNHYPNTEIGTAIILIERAYDAEIEAHAVSARIWGRSGRSRFAIRQLSELRLILRWIRRMDRAGWRPLINTILAQGE